jgi:hypothetical protein
MFVVNLALSDCIMMTTMGPPVTINAFAKVNIITVQYHLTFQSLVIENEHAKAVLRIRIRNTVLKPGLLLEFSHYNLR